MLSSMRSSAKYIWIFLILFFVGGFLLVDTSGLMGRAQVTPGTAVATVNGDDITYGTWLAVSQQLAEQREQQIGRSLTLDERQDVENEAFEQLISETLLRQEYEQRGIGVTDAEIRQLALSQPPPELRNSPELQTDGQFDPAKYTRFLASPVARQQGLLVQLENYYRQEIPRGKLFAQVAADAYVSDAELWRLWQDQRDSAEVSFVALRPELVPDAEVQVTDAEVRSYFDANRENFERVGRAAVSLLTIERNITAADTAASRARAEQLRARIAAGEEFAEVARQESIDGSSAQGGELGRAAVTDYVPEFAEAVRTLPVGTVSEPVLTQFGYHVIRVDERQGDSVEARHILLPIAQSDSNAVATDRVADRLAALAATSDDPAVFDSAARELGLAPRRGVVLEGERLVVDGRTIPDVAAWAFAGAEVGETSDLVAADEGYYLARLDSVRTGGIPEFDAVRDEVRQIVLREKKLDALMTRGQQIASQATSGTLETAAQAAGLTLQRSVPFNRIGFVDGLGQANQAIGAAFALPVGSISAPIRTPDGVFVLRVERRTNADRAEWEAQREVQRALMSQQYQQRRVQQYLTNLREAADVTDRRSEIRALLRNVETP